MKGDSNDSKVKMTLEAKKWDSIEFELSSDDEVKEKKERKTSTDTSPEEEVLLLE